MSELEKPEDLNEETTTTESTEPTQVDKDKAELIALKARADTIGLKYHPKIGLIKLKERVNEQLNKPAEEVIKEKVQEKVAEKHIDMLPDAPQTETYQKTSRKESASARKVRLRKQAGKLIRIRVTCMNPVKKAWEGEIFTVSNSVVGTFKKFVPFNVDNGWHIPQMMLDMLQERKFVEHFISGKDSRGRPIKRHRLVREFAIEIMDPLTLKELDDLRRQQAMAGTIGKE